MELVVALFVHDYTIIRQDINSQQLITGECVSEMAHVSWELGSGRRKQEGKQGERKAHKIEYEKERTQGI
jgi:hypothetical protein